MNAFWGLGGRSTSTHAQRASLRSEVAVRTSRTQTYLVASLACIFVDLCSCRTVILSRQIVSSDDSCALVGFSVEVILPSLIQ